MKEIINTITIGKWRWLSHIVRKKHKKWSEIIKITGKKIRIAISKKKKKQIVGKTKDVCRVMSK